MIFPYLPPFLEIKVGKYFMIYDDRRHGIIKALNIQPVYRHTDKEQGMSNDKVKRMIVPCFNSFFLVQYFFGILN